jgi:hypothetical protein
MAGVDMEIDYYTEARLIADAIGDQGHAEIATTLRDAVEYGSTATEILMALRYHLTELIASGTLADPLTIARSRRLMAALDEELR